MPQQMAEQTADDLLSLGQKEFDRFNKVASGLIAARDAITAIDAIEEEKPDETDNAGNGPAGRRPIRTSDRDN